MLGKNNKLNINETTLKILALYRSDYRRALHTREIARSVATDVQPISVQLKRLAGAGILTSVARGKHKEYTLTLSNLLTKYYVSLAETYTTITFLDRYFLIKRVLEELQRGDNTLLGTLVLFGSFAAERADERSDVDLLTITEHPSKKDTVRTIETVIGRDINVMSMTPPHFMEGLRRASPFEREVVAHHIVLQDIDRFCTLMWRVFGIWG
jgi:predicted nucleotidyltransferase